MPCLSSSAFSALKESSSVSNAESQLALPLAITTFFASNVIGSPKGSAVWTVAEGAGAGVCDACGEGELAGAGEGLAAGAAGAGLAATSADGAAAGWASAAPPESAKPAAAIRAARARRRKQERFIQLGSMAVSGTSNPAGQKVNTPGAFSSHDRSVISLAGWSKGDASSYKTVGIGYFDERARQPRLRQ